MPSIRAGRAALVTLSAVLVMGASTVVSASDESAPTFVAPPSLELALTSLTGAPVPVAAGSAPAAGPEIAKVRLPACGIKDVRTRFGSVRQWKKTLLDTNLKIGRRYQPADLVPVGKANLKGTGLVRKIIIKDLRTMAAAARKAGKPLAVRSAFRTYQYQSALFASYVRQYGFTKAASFSARPGHSEHQLGTTIDFTTAPSVPLTTRFGESPSGKWIAKHGWKYGFIMSYPRNKKSSSCYSYEPWHWRYFGRDVARKIHDSGQVPRRYLYEHYESRP